MPEPGTLLPTLGVITNVSDYLRSTDALKVGNNLNVIQRGIFTNRYSGWERQSEEQFNSAATIHDFGVFIGTDGTKTLLFQAGSKLYKYDLVTKAETEVLGSLSADNLPCMRLFQPYSDSAPFMVYCNGQEPKKITDLAPTTSTLQLNSADWNTGALATPLPNTMTLPNPRFCEKFLDRMVFAGFSGTAALHVMVTDPGTAESCTASTPPVATDGGLLQLNPNLGLCTGLKAFKLSNESSEEILIIAQERGVGMLVGTSALNFQYRVLTTDYGIPSNRTWIEINNQVFFIATDGIRSFNTLVANATLVNASLTFPVQDLVNRFNLTHIHKAHAVHVRKYMEMQFWFPVDSDTTCGSALILSYNNEQSMGAEINPILLTKTGTTVASSIYFDKQMYGGGYTGYIQTHHMGNLYDATPAGFRIVPALARHGNSRTLAALSAQVITEGEGDKFLISSYYHTTMSNNDTRRKQAQPSVTTLSGGGEGGTALGSWVLGADSFPAAIPRRYRYDPQGKGHAWELDISGNASDHYIDFMGINYELEPEGAQAA